MDISVENRLVEDGFVTLAVRVAKKELESLERGAYMVVAQRNGIDISGEGLVREILERELSEEKATSLMLDALKNFTAPFALSGESEDYSVVGAPAFSEGKEILENGDMIFSATWVRLPQLELSSYDPVEITVPPIAVTDEEIDARVDEVAESYKTVERDKTRKVVKDGDIVQISMDCQKDGKRFGQLCFSDRLYRAGSAQMPEAFDKAVMGAKVGQTVHVDFLLPTRQEFDGTVSGPSICADVTINSLMKEVTHVLTDEFVAQNIPNVANLAELREQCRKELVQQKEEQMRHYRNFVAAGELSKRVEGSIADEVYDAVVDQMTESLREQAKAEHTTVSDLLKAQGSSEEQFRMMTLMQARNQLRQGAAIDAWARHRGIVVEDADVDAFFESSAQGHAAQMREEIENGGYWYLAREGARRLKANEDLLATAIVHEDAELQMPAGAAPAAMPNLD